MRGEAFGPDGPDPGFPWLAPETVGWFGAIGSFYNLQKHRGDASGSADAGFRAMLSSG